MKYITFDKVMIFVLCCVFGLGGISIYYAFKRDDACRDACLPDMVVRNTCSTFRTLCMSKDKVYVKEVK
jgi:hypothetical protein